MISFRERQQEIWNAEAAILAGSQNLPMPANSLIQQLVSTYSDYSVRAAIWALVDRGDIVLREASDGVLVENPVKA